MNNRAQHLSQFCRQVSKSALPATRDESKGTGF